MARPDPMLSSLIHTLQSENAKCKAEIADLKQQIKYLTGEIKCAEVICDMLETENKKLKTELEKR